MKIHSENDKSYVKNLVEPYSLDLILAKSSKDIQEIGSNFLLAFADIKYHPFVIKNNGVWCIFVSDQKTSEMIMSGGTELTNIYEVTYLNVLQRIKFIQRLNDEHLIFSTSDIKFKMDVDCSKLIQNGRKIEDNEVCAFLDEYQEKKIYPTDELIKLYVHKFKTTDEIRYKWQQIVNWIAIAIAVITAFFSLMLTKCTQTTLNKEQLDDIRCTINTNQKEISNRLDSIIVSNNNRHSYIKK
jgi:hypothetical protein